MKVAPPSKQYYYKKPVNVVSESKTYECISNAGMPIARYKAKTDRERHLWRIQLATYIISTQQSQNMRHLPTSSWHSIESAWDIPSTTTASEDNRSDRDVRDWILQSDTDAAELTLCWGGKSGAAAGQVQEPVLVRSVGGSIGTGHCESKPSPAPWSPRLRQHREILAERRNWTDLFVTHNADT